MTDDYERDALITKLEQAEADLAAARAEYLQQSSDAAALVKAQAAEIARLLEALGAIEQDVFQRRPFSDDDAVLLLNAIQRTATEALRESLQ